MKTRRPRPAGVRWPDSWKGPYWEPRDIWLGVFWNRGDAAISVYVCLVPCFPVRMRWYR